jgi:hypothetical protein
VICEPCLHYPFSRGLEEWLSRHDRYSSQECAATLEAVAGAGLDLGGLVARRDPVRRRRALKALSMHLPGRPQLRFLYMYLLRLGVLDGRAGLLYCRLMAGYERQIQRKVRAARATRAGSTTCGS